MHRRGSGRSGVGVGTDGRPVGFLRVCSYATWSVDSGGNGWAVTKPFATLKPGQAYHLYGWTNDNTSPADPVDFTAADLAAMKPGQVRYRSGRANATGDKDLEVVTTAVQFQQHACDRYR